MNKEKKIINNVSATTAIDLKAELAQHVEQFEKTRATSGKQSTAKRPDKKPTVWTKQNKGVNERNQRDKVKQLEAVEGDVLQRSREQLEKKARLYEAMQSGEFNVDEMDDEKMPLVDFDRKYFQERELERQKEEAASENRRKKRKHNEKDDDDNDPWVEFEDEFGRTRIVRRSELPSTHQQQQHSDSDYDSEDDDNIAYLQKQQRYQAADRSNMNHFEAGREIRTKGVGFYQFSKDEQERRAQLDKLNRLRTETENARNSQASASSKRKQMLAQNAEKIRARRAALKAKKHHQLKPDQQIPTDQGPTNVTEDSVTDFLKSIRKQIE